ncbi:uncharacterized protein LOC116267081 [Nymphaea colorata]|nr:uncharacterized protein LOC116267081 [Nymphaea colorata]XP_031504502.1 uncharacterized protein LOC116267081 [Nymphaea colorata]
MAMYRQSGWTDRVGLRGGGGCPGDNGGSNSNSNDHHHHHHEGGGPPPDSVSVRVAPHHRVGAAGARNRRSGRSEKALLKLSSRRGLLFILPSLLLIFVTFFAFSILSRDTKDVQHFYDQTKTNSMDSLSNATKKNAAFKVLKFGHGSVSLGRDSRYWDGDDRRRDDEYNEDAVEHYNVTISISRGRKHVREKWKKQEDPYKSAEGHVVTSVSENVPVKGTFGRPLTKQTWNYKNKRLYNEGGQNELKHYEAEFQASKEKEEGREKYSSSDSHSAQKNKNKLSSMEDMDEGSQSDKIDIDDEYDIDVQDINVDDEIDGSNDQTDSSFQKYHSKKELVSGITREDSSILSERSAGDKAQNVHNGGAEGHSAKTTSLGTKSSVKRRGKRHKNTSASCGMKFLNSSSHVIEPLESKKFMRFSLHYTEREDAPSGLENWEPRFAGHQSLEERERSFNASDQRINCGFVKGPSGFPSTGFDLAEDDMKFMSSCHIAVSSCIFGNSDRLRVPNNKMVSRLSRKSVCFVMFVDENTLETMSLEGQKPDQMGFVGLWKIVVVKNLPYSDMRRVGKVPKFLAHRLFTTARYSIWLDSKLRLQNDPLLILEYFLFRKGHEYAISNHYDRHCVWEEVMQNKRLDKFNHTLIDQQFDFYQADGLKRFNASDSDKLLPSYVPEGSFIVRAHTAMSNLFSCLWFNEVDRFTPRDQLSFAYTYLKLRKMNPEKPFYLHMFKDCERRLITKLYRHRNENKRNLPSQAIE